MDRLTKPPMDDPYAVFKYGVECGIEQERERIIALLEATEELRTIEAGSLVNYADIAIALIKGDVAERRQTQMSEYGDNGKNK